MFKKRLLILLVSALMLTSLSSCSEAEKESSSEETSAQTGNFEIFRDLRTGWRLYDWHLND